MTKIEWTEETFNPIRARNLRTGGVGHFCVKISPGCKECYAEAFQPRLGNPVRYAAQDREKVDLFLDEAVLRKPLAWKRAREIFPCSMTDIFGEFVPGKWIDRILAVAALTPQHTYQVLTKRADLMMRYFNDWPDGAARRNHVFVEILKLLGHDDARGAERDEIVRRAQLLTSPQNWPLKNWRQGISVEDRKRAEERIPMILAADVAFRWISAEPLLEQVDLHLTGHPDDVEWRRLHGGSYERRFIDWVVVGGESGPRARVCDVHWIRDVVRQCRSGTVPVFVKQVGRKATTDHRTRPAGEASHWTAVIKDAKGGDPKEWPEDLRVRERPQGRPA